MLITPTLCLMSWLLSVPLLRFTLEAELAAFILQLGELRCLERRWPLQGHLLGSGCIWTESRSLHPNQALFLLLVVAVFLLKASCLHQPHVWRAKVYSLHLESSCSSEAFWLQSKEAVGWGRFELCTTNSVILWQSTGRVHGACFPGAKRECLWYHKIDCVCLSKLNGLYTAWYLLIRNATALPLSYSSSGNW